MKKVLANFLGQVMYSDLCSTCIALWPHSERSSSITHDLLSFMEESDSVFCGNCGNAEDSHAFIYEANRHIVHANWEQVIYALKALHWVYGAGDVLAISRFSTVLGESVAAGYLFAKRTSCRPEYYHWHATPMANGKWRLRLHNRQATADPVQEEVL